MSSRIEGGFSPRRILANLLNDYRAARGRSQTQRTPAISGQVLHSRSRARSHRRLSQKLDNYYRAAGGRRQAQKNTTESGRLLQSTATIEGAFSPGRVFANMDNDYIAGQGRGQTQRTPAESGKLLQRRWRARSDRRVPQNLDNYYRAAGGPLQAQETTADSGRLLQSRSRIEGGFSPRNFLRIWSATTEQLKGEVRPRELPQNPAKYYRAGQGRGQTEDCREHNGCGCLAECC